MRFVRSVSQSNVVSLDDHRNTENRTRVNDCSKIRSSKPGLDQSKSDKTDAKTNCPNANEVAEAGSCISFDNRYRAQKEINNDQNSDQNINQPGNADSARGPVKNFELVQYLEQLNFLASIEIVDISELGQRYSYKIRNRVLFSVNKILCQEFGRNRVWRDGFVFYTRQRNVDELIAGLLRVQFYAKQIELVEQTASGSAMSETFTNAPDPHSNCKLTTDSVVSSVNIVWGVGRNRAEAGHECGRKRQQKSLLT